MGLGLKRREATGDIPVYQVIHEVSQGGYTLDIQGLIPGTTIPAGTVIIADDATRKAKIVKSAKVVEVAAADALVYKISKDNQFVIGDNIALVLKGKAYAITAVDRSNALYDSVTVGTTLGAAAVDTSVFQSSTTGATNSALSGVPAGLLLEARKVETNTSLTVALRATVYARRIPGVAADVKALLPLIIFSQSK